MITLVQQIQAFNDLITAGNTLQAMELYYAEEVVLQENEEPPRVGKFVCMAHEKKLLSHVSGLQIKILSQGIDASNAVVLTELELQFTNASGETRRIVEVSVQHWQAGKIGKEKFYYRP
jgi:hypothetical protein